MFVLALLFACGGAIYDSGDVDQGPVQVTGPAEAVPMSVGPFQVLACAPGEVAEVCLDVTARYPISGGLLCIADTPTVCEVGAPNASGRLLIFGGL